MYVRWQHINVLKHFVYVLCGCKKQFEDSASDPEPQYIVVSFMHGTQDVCTVNKVRKYHTMCKMVVSVYVAIETQQWIFC
jgi:hypothetical protein